MADKPPGKDLLVGVDIGGTKILAAVVTTRGGVLARVKLKVPKRLPAAGVVELVQRAIDEVLAKVDRGRQGLKAIGVAVPGIVDAGKGKVVITANIKLSGVPLGQILRRRYHRPVILGNDVNLALLGEQWRGAARGRRNVVGLFPGTGIGGGVLIDGRLLQGANGAAAELGHIQLETRGPQCGCGKRGCLEALASRSAIERDIRAALKEGVPSAVSKLSDGDLSRIRSKVLKKALKKGDKLVSSVVGHAAQTMGRACVSLRQVFDPEVFIFGGGLVEACGQWILPVVEKTLKKDPFFRHLGPCPVLAAELGDDAVAIGAAALARLL